MTTVLTPRVDGGVATPQQPQLRLALGKLSLLTVPSVPVVVPKKHNMLNPLVASSEARPREPTTTDRTMRTGGSAKETPHARSYLSSFLGSSHQDGVCYRPDLHVSVVVFQKCSVTLPNRSLADDLPIDTGQHRYRCGRATGRMRSQLWNRCALRGIRICDTIDQPMGQSLSGQGGPWAAAWGLGLQTEWSILRLLKCIV